MNQTTDFRRTLEQLLSRELRPFVKSHGFAKSGRKFSRRRGPLCDLITIQGDKWNGLDPHHSFFVHISLGSTEMDEIYLGFQNDLELQNEYVLECNWARLVADTPVKWAFDARTAITVFADTLVDSRQEFVR